MFWKAKHSESVIWISSSSLVNIVPGDEEMNIFLNTGLTPARISLWARTGGNRKGKLYLSLIQKINNKNISTTFVGSGGLDDIKGDISGKLRVGTKELGPVHRVDSRHLEKRRHRGLCCDDHSELGHAGGCHTILEVIPCSLHTAGTN